MHYFSCPTERYKLLKILLQWYTKFENFVPAVINAVKEISTLNDVIN